MSDRHHLHWATVLDRLELDVIRAERLVAEPDRPAPSRPSYAGSVEVWDVPLVEGPIPVGLQDRALDLHARQRAVQAALTAELAAVRRQQDLASRVDRATGQVRSAGSVYLDITA